MSGRHGGDKFQKRRNGARKRDWQAPRVTPREAPRPDLRGAVVAAYGMYIVSLAGALLTL